eukprot:TRINITY_DN66564_c4_g1_i1.p2 TRINITY_DN66564_c4_g1~~TRINITY_DN66564_c4_g1_i1.p2  ORF type:complete len:137 (+),score=55.77 TRINITY_DN66564_c4_g1_i1:37-411(+)
MRVSQDAFLNELIKLIERSKDEGKGSVNMCFKRILTSEEKIGGKPKKHGKHAQDIEPVCLLRATLGSKKISTIIPFKDHVRFQQQVGVILKVHMDGLKQRKSKKNKLSSKKVKRKTRNRSSNRQ